VLTRAVRSPCPFMNSLANHHLIPHDGRGITRETIVQVLASTVNFDPVVASRFFSAALLSNPNHGQQTLDLDMLGNHGALEHDASLSRNDFAFGDNHSFDKEIWTTVLEDYGGNDAVDINLASKVRYNRVVAAKLAHETAAKEFNYGIKQMLLSYGESALLLSVLGDPENKVPLNYIKTLIGKFS
jgi:peroxidase family protein